MTACPDRQADLSALVDDALPPDEARALEEHLAECGGCKAEREALQQVAEQLRALPRRAPPPSFTAGVMAQVVGALPDDGPDMLLLVEEPPPQEATPSAMTFPAPAPAAAPAPAPAPAASPPAAAAAGPASLTCELLREDVTAHADGELEGDAARRLEEHLAACPTCRAGLQAEHRLHARLRALPRVRPHDLFVSQVMARVEAEELARADEARRHAAQRAQRWRLFGFGLQAAGLLVAAALTLNVTAPEDLPEGRLPARSDSGTWTRPRARAEDPAASGGPAAFAPPLDGPFDVTLELRAPQGLDPALDAALSAASRTGGRVLATRITDVQREVDLQVPASLLDDYYLQCDREAELDGTPEAARRMEQVWTEQDRVVLKTGVVVAGRIVAEGRHGLELEAAGLRQTIRRDRVERVVRAAELRRVRVVLRSEEP